MSDSTAVIESNEVGRPAKAKKHAGAIAEAEGRFSDKLPEVADMAVELATGRKPQTCRYHHEVFACRRESCSEESKGIPANPDMVKYVLNRIMGSPGQSLDRQINLEFVSKVTDHITAVFKDCNLLEDAQERANVFAQGISQLWILIGLAEEDA